MHSKFIQIFLSDWERSLHIHNKRSTQNAPSTLQLIRERDISLLWMMHTSPHRKVVTYGCRLCLTKFRFFDSSFLGVRYMQTKERIVYVLEVSPGLLLFSIGVYMRLKLQSNDRKLQSDEIFCIILFFFLEIENWDTLIADAVLWILHIYRNCYFLFFSLFIYFCI